jgi:cell fate (sporulation/competence/biofilm development) regulator YlbF (YheA/YmcA/DUF963 family)
MNLNLKTTPEFLQDLETLLYEYEHILDDHLYSIYAESDFRKAQDRLSTILAEMNNLIGQAQTQIIIATEEEG